MVFLIPLVSVAVGLALGYWLIRAGHKGVFVGLMLAGALAFGWTIWDAQGKQGFDGIGNAIIAILVLTPLELGGLIGAGLAFFRAARARAAEGDGPR